MPGRKGGSTIAVGKGLQWTDQQGSDGLGDGARRCGAASAGDPHCWNTGDFTCKGSSSGNS